MNTTKLKTASAFFGTWVLRLAPFWAPVALAIFMLSVGLHPLWWLAFLVVLAMLAITTYVNEPGVPSIGFCVALTVSFTLLLSAVTVYPSDAYIHDGVVAKSKTESTQTYGFWHGYTVVQNTQQNVSYEVKYLGDDGAKRTLRVGLDYDVPAELILEHHANGAAPDYQEAFETALERAVLLTVQETSPKDPQATTQVILGHLQAQLGDLGSSVKTLSVEIEGTTVTHTSSQAS